MVKVVSGSSPSIYIPCPLNAKLFVKVQSLILTRDQIFRVEMLDSNKLHLHDLLFTNYKFVIKNEDFFDHINIYMQMKYHCQFGKKEH